MKGSTALTDKRFEALLGQILRAGVLIAAAVVLAGGVLYLAKYGAQAPHYGIFRGQASDLRYVPEIFRDALAWHARGLIQLGLLILIATPVARVAFSVVAFTEEKDWLYVATTLIVLAILIYSLSSS